MEGTSDHRNFKLNSYEDVYLMLDSALRRPYVVEACRRKRRRRREGEKTRQCHVVQYDRSGRVK